MSYSPLSFAGSSVLSLTEIERMTVFARWGCKRAPNAPANSNRVGTIDHSRDQLRRTSTFCRVNLWVKPFHQGGADSRDEATYREMAVPLWHHRPCEWVMIGQKVLPQCGFMMRRSWRPNAESADALGDDGSKVAFVANDLGRCHHDCEGVSPKW